MHITHIVPTLDQRYGGPVTSICGFASALQLEGVSNSAFAALQPAETISEMVTSYADEGLEIVSVNDARGTRRQHPDTKRLLAALLDRSDIVHMHGVWEAPQAIAAALCKQRRIPFVVRPCGMLSRYCLAQKRLKKWAYIQLRLKGMLRKAAAVHFTSEHESGEAPQFIQAEKRVIETLGIDFRVFEAEMEGNFDVRERYDISAAVPLLTFLGRLNPIKGLETLLYALRKLIDSHAKLSLLICGPAEYGYDKRLKHIVEELGLKKYVRFGGMVNRIEIRDILSQSDIFVLPSHHENFGVSALEALACGTPVVISEHVGIECFLRNAEVGIVAGGTSSAFAEAISTLIDSPETRQRYAANCRRVAEETFAWNNIARRWIRRYERLMEQET